MFNKWQFVQPNLQVTFNENIYTHISYKTKKHR